MKNLILKSAALLFIISMFVGTVNAQRLKGNGKMINKARSVGNFDGVAVAGSFDVYLVSGEEGKLDIRVDENLEPYLITEVEKGVLKVRWQKGKNIRTSSKTTVTVHFKDINSLAMSGSGDIVARDQIKGSDLEIAVAGSGDIEADMAVQHLSAAVSGSGDLNLSGKAGMFEAAVSGSGDVDAGDLLTEKAELKISGSGTVRANVEQELMARISGSGNVKYKGNPRIEDIKVSGSGNVSSY